MNFIESAVNRLKTIADKNEDEFRFDVQILTDRRGIKYYFECSEQAERHVFINGNGVTIEEAVSNAIGQLEGALGAWGYTE